jgi:hypothetical protein
MGLPTAGVRLQPVGAATAAGLPTQPGPAAASVSPKGGDRPGKGLKRQLTQVTEQIAAGMFAGESVQSLESGAFSTSPGPSGTDAATQQQLSPPLGKAAAAKALANKTFHPPAAPGSPPRLPEGTVPEGLPGGSPQPGHMETPVKQQVLGSPKSGDK